MTFEEQTPPNSEDVPKSYFLPRLLNSLGVGDKSWSSFIESPSWDAVQRFIEHPNDLTVMFYFSGSELMATKKPPPKGSCSSKILYFLKLQPTTLSTKDPSSSSDTFKSSSIITGEINPSASIIHHMATLAQYVVKPLITTSTASASTLTLAASRELKEATFEFMSGINIASEALNDKVLLTMPLEDNDSTGISGTTTMEASVSRWTKQIREAVDETLTDWIEESGLHNHPHLLSIADYWMSRATKLSDVNAQLMGGRAKRVVALLEKAKSPCLDGFKTVTQKLGRALDKAGEMSGYMSHLRPLFKELVNEDTGFGEELTSLFRPVMHTLMLVWKLHPHNTYFNNSIYHLMEILSAIQDALVKQAQQYIGSIVSLLNGDATEGLEMLTNVQSTLAAFKNVCFEYSSRIAAECSQDKSWNLTSNSINNKGVFGTIDEFMKRCHGAQNICKAALSFARLEKIDIGGEDGELLTKHARALHAEFVFLLAQLRAANNGKEGELLNPHSKEGDAVFVEFREGQRLLEKRLSVLLGTAMTDGDSSSSSVASILRIYRGFEGLVEHSGIISQYMEARLEKVMRQFVRELLDARTTFDRERRLPPLPRGAAPQSGSLMWARSLMHRVEGPMLELKELPCSKALFESDHGQEVVRLYNALVHSVMEFEGQLLQQWIHFASELSLRSLSQPVLAYQKNKDSVASSPPPPPSASASSFGSIIVNFDPALMQLVQEVDGFLLLHPLQRDIPEPILKLHSNAGSLRQHVSSLDWVASIYIDLKKGLNPVEGALLHPRLHITDQLIVTCLKGDLTWQSADLAERSGQLSQGAHSVAAGLAATRSAIGKIKDIAGKWQQGWNLLNSSNGNSNSNKSGGNLSGNKMLASVQASALTELYKRRMAIQSDVDHIRGLLDSLLSELKELTPSSPAWQGFLNSVSTSMGYDMTAAATAAIHSLLPSSTQQRAEQQMNAVLQESTNTCSPSSLESLPGKGVKILLDIDPGEDRTIYFVPPIFLPQKHQLRPTFSATTAATGSIKQSGKSLESVVDLCISSISSMGDSIYQLHHHHGGGDVSKQGGEKGEDSIDGEQRVTFGEVIRRDPKIAAAKEWATAQLKVVADQGHQLASQFDRYTFLWEEDMLQVLDNFVALNSITDSCEDPDRQAQSFKAIEVEIAKYYAIQSEIQRLPSVVNYGWIAIDCSQVKQAALMAASKWSFVFLEHLRSHIVGNVHRAYSFIEQASTTLNSNGNDATATVPSSRRGSIAARSSNRITQSPGLGNNNKTGSDSPASRRQSTVSIQHGSRQSMLSGGGADGSVGQESSSRSSRLGNQGGQRPSIVKRASSSLSESKRQSVNDGSSDPQTKRRSSTLTCEGSGSKMGTLSQGNNRQSVVVGTALADRQTSTSGRKSTVVLSAKPVLDPQQNELYDVLSCMREVKTRKEELTSLFEPLSKAVTVLDKLSNNSSSAGGGAASALLTGISPELQQQIQEGPAKLRSLEKKALKKREELASLRAAESIGVRRRADRFVKQLEAYRTFLLKKAPFGVPTDSTTKEAAAVVTSISGEHVSNATGLLVALEETGMDGCPSLVAFEEAGKEIHNQQELLELSLSDFSPLTACRDDLTQLRELWTVVSNNISVLQGWSGQPWKTVQIEMLQEEIKKMMKEVKTLPKRVKSWAVFVTLETMLREAQDALPLIADLSHPAMRPRHWGMLATVTATTSPSAAFTVPVPTTPLGYLLSLNIHKHIETVADVVDRAQKELTIEKALDKIETTWNSMTVKFDHASPLLGAVALSPAADKVPLLVVDVTMKESLENDALTLQTMSSGRYVQGHPVFSQMVEKWQRLLADVDAVTSTWGDVQKRWQAMRAIFGASADIRDRLPEQCVRFDKVDEDFKSLMSSAAGTGTTVAATAAHTKDDKLLDVCSVEGRLKRLHWQLMELESCEKALQNYLETKRIAFPRFYFMSPSDLLDLLARGADPHAVTHHLSKIFDNLHALEWQKDNKTDKPINVAVGMYSGEKEYVPFAEPCKCDGPVELWLGSLVHAMKSALKSSYRNAMLEYEEMPRTDWIFKHPAQTAVIASRTHFTNEIEQAFAELEDGNEEALSRALNRQKTHLSQLIEVINGDMSKNDRKKAITLCTIDVHARDVLSRLIENRSESSDSFQWQSQLRYVTDENTGDCKVLICDAEIDYQYEYIGNCGCLCITPLTDRCYITLTQAQKLILGGAPAGPAGTGKTETTKDLARALGLQCYVFNCSDQMDYKAMGQIYKGLAQTGAWGCFDEFNRIPVSVLSVCSTQYKSVLDALRAKKDKFMFEGHQIALKPSAMAFITMNPGYAGRAELPESLKALFRPVSMAAPDLSLICEIMLMAEGFQNSHILARKFIILYRLCEDLLSKAQHYDWKLRAIKTTLYVAGGMKRAAPHMSEDKVLLRALRDFNLGKLTQDDAPVFLGLLNDLFPKTLELVPRAVDMPFEAAIKEAALELGYRPDPTFCLKVGQLREIFSVRWSVFLLGPAGAGKTAIWKTLARAQEKVGENTVFKIINPKAVTTDELYGSLHPTTREWREGLLSSTFRDFAAASSSTTTVAAGSSGSAAAPKHQWIILDGDIDPEWIESMNTVMDDNKMLTLASNERISLTSSMKLLLEINHMKHCSPATVTRGGVIYVNADDLGWKPVADSWVEKLQCRKDTKAMLNTLLAKYVESTLEFVKKMCKVVLELPAVNQVQTLYKLMDSMMKLEEKQQQLQDVDRKLLEAQFVYACVWALGGNVTTECRSVFSNWWIATFKTVPFPGIASTSSTGATAKTRSIGTAKQPRTSSSAITNSSTPTPGGETVFDYFVDEESSEMLCWSSRLPTAKPAIATEDIFVPTIQTTALNNVLSLLIQAGHNTMLVGGAGSGKSALLNQQLQSLDTYGILQHSVHLNSQLTGPALQQTLELPLEKRVGIRYGASGNRRMLYFLKGLNMPKVDKYETQTALELVRQSIDCGGWYSKPSNSKSGSGGGNNVTFKEIQSLQYVATMNPSSGSFTVTPRMQRQFATFAVHMPGADELKTIYRYILEDHFTTKRGFKDDIVDLVRSSNRSSNEGVLLEAVVDLHEAVVAAFPPSAVNFTYQFTLREISGVIRGLCRANAAVITSPKKLLRLWTHESDRVYGDRLADVGDKTKYEDLRRSAAKKAFSGIVKSLVDIEAKPLLFADFMHVKINGGEDDDEEENVPKQAEGATASGGQTAAVSSIRVYEEISDYDSLHKVLYKFMGETSSDQQKKNGATTSSSSSVDQDSRQHNLVLFPEASQHVVAIARALSTGQHPLLIGPGGSGRQSLARLAAKVAGFEAVSLASTADYALPEFITDLMSVYQKTGVKNIPCALILTDSQLSHDSMLVPLNDLLATAEHAGLCSNSEDKDAICAAVKNEARAAGMLDTPAQLWGFFLSRVRANLRIVLCASPVGDRLRVWARRFPALMSSMAFDTFGGWPRTALCAVSQRLLLENNNSSATISDGNMSAGPLVLDKSLVESVSEAAAAIHEAVAAACVKYWTVYRRRAYVTPKSFLELVSMYNQLLKQKREELKNAKLRLQNGVSKISEARSAVLLLQKELEKEQVVVEEKKAAAAALVDSLGVEKAAADVAVEAGKGNEAAAIAIQEEVSSAQLACAADLEKAEPIIKEAEAALNSLDKASLGELKSFSKPAPDIVAVVAACMVLTAPAGKPVKDLSWPAAKRWMGDVNALIKSLTAFDKDNVPVAAVDRVEHEFVSQQGFKPDLVRTKSFAAAGLCSWVINICKYSRIYAIVAPKRAALAEANSRLDDSNRRLAGARSYVAGLLSKVAALQDELAAATAAKNAAIAQAENTARKAALAEKLISGLAGEYVRWQASIEALARQEKTIIGDALLSAAFVAYAGAFNTPLRRELVNQHWLPQIQKENIPIATATSSTSGKDGKENMHSKGDGNSNNSSSGEEHGLDGLSLVLEFLITARDKACWIQEGLPTDSHSQENAAIVGFCTSSSSSPSSESCKSGGRWPLLIDPQLQGAKWVAAKEGGHGLITTRLTANGYLDAVAKAVETGVPLLIENLPEELDPVLLPLLTRQLVNKGGFKYVNIGGTDVRCNASFRLYLQTRLAAPHYGPEVAAQITLINFCVTKKGLESQLLGAVVGHERPELQQQASILTSQLAEYSITLKSLEDKLLAGLAASKGDILEDIELIQSLEQTKSTAVEVATKVQQAQVTGARLTAAREVFRPVAARGAAMYFIMDTLPLLNRVYCYSMASFMQLLKRGMDACSSGGDDRQSNDRDEVEEGDDIKTTTSVMESYGSSEDIQAKVARLTNSITASFYSEVCQGLFEKHKLSVAVQLAFTVLKERGELSLPKWTYLLKCSSSCTAAAAAADDGGSPAALNAASYNILAPEWLQRGGAWTRLLALSMLEGFSSIPQETTSSGSKRWKEWMECSLPEEMPLPGEWKRASHLDKLLILKAFRPDRIAPAFYNFVALIIGQQYATPPTVRIQVALKHASPSIPVLFFLSPGIDVAGAVEAAAKQGNNSNSNSGQKSQATVAAPEQRSYATVSLGQGQEELAMAALEKAREHGGWVLLQNIHLTIDWTSTALSRFIDALEVGSDAGGGGGSQDTTTTTNDNNINAPHPDFRLLLSAEPPPSLEQSLPTSLLQACIKVTNEPPRGLKANLLRSLSLLDEDLIEGCSRPGELKAIMFALSFFHAAILERKRFGVGNRMSSRSGLGWNMDYPFSAGDLRCCVAIAANALENASVGGGLPWEDMRYMFGDIMYGGHIVENWDRRLAGAYLESIFNDGLLLPGAEVFPGLALPPASASSSGGGGGVGTAVATAMGHVEKNMPAENPIAFGLNQNADITCLLAEASSLCDDLVVLAPESSSDDDSNGDTGGTSSTNTKEQTTATDGSGLQAMLVEDILRRLPEAPSTDDIRSRTSDSSGAPFAAVLLQECHALHTLISNIKSNLGELESAINGQLTMTLQLEVLAANIADDVVPKAWITAAGSPSLRSLSSWIDQLGNKAAQLDNWALTDPAAAPKSVWLGGLSNPQAFLTAVLQTAARRNGWALDRTALVTEVTRKTAVDQIDSLPRDGAYVHGLWLEGASWDDGAGSTTGGGGGGGGALMDGRPGELMCQIPILLLKAVPVEKAELKDVYECPVYWTQCRFRQEVFTAQLKTKQSWGTWTKAGVAMFLDI